MSDIEADHEKKGHKKVIRRFEQNGFTLSNSHGRSMEEIKEEDDESNPENREDRNSDSENEESGHRVKKLKVSKRKQPPSSDIQMDSKAMTIE